MREKETQVKITLELLIVHGYSLKQILSLVVHKTISFYSNC